MSNNPDKVQLALQQLRASEAIRANALQVLEAELLQQEKPKKGLSQSQKTKILTRFFKNQVNQ